MAPALTKILKRGHGIHLSSPSSSARVDSNRWAVLSTESGSDIRFKEDNDPQMMWLNVLSFPSLESCLPMSSLNVPAKLMFSCQQASDNQWFFCSPASLLSFLSFNEDQRISHQEVSFLPGVPDMFLGTVPEHNGQEAYPLHGCDAAHECGPDGGDVHRSSLTLSAVSSSDSLGEITSQGYSLFFTPPQTVSQEGAANVGCALPVAVQSCGGRLNVDQLPSRSVLEEAGRKQHTTQAGLYSQAWSKPYFLWLDLCTASSSNKELRETTYLGQAEQRGQQEALDYETTASSSSDDESEEERTRNKTITSPASSSSCSCESRWLEERAEVGSSWSWLQLRLSELEGRIQQLVELHKHVRSTKGQVVLAASTDRLNDAESCSPMRLLHNMEKQSAQVSSLIPPLSFSPPAKQAQTCRAERSFISGLKGGNVFVPSSIKRSRMGTTRLYKTDVSRGCARTRPLLFCQKPKLFNIYSPDSQQDSLSSSSCSCSSCDPVVLCSDHDVSSSSAMSLRKHSSGPHHVLSPLFDTPLAHDLQRTFAGEEWSQRPLVINAHSSAPALHHRCESTPLHNSHKHRQHARHRKSRDIGLSIIRSRRRRANHRKRRQRRIRMLIKDEDDDDQYQPWELEEFSDGVLEESYTQFSHKQTSQGSIVKCHGVTVCSINDIVIPSSLTKVKKLQYKDILTPRWRVVSTQSLMEHQADDEDGQVEDLCDEVFGQRHMALEHWESMRWSSWGKRKRCRRSTSRLCDNGVGMCTSGEESSAEWSGAQLENGEQPSSEEWLPQTPWKPRLFPLDEEEEEALLCDRAENIPSCWSWSGSVSCSSMNS
uniref:KAT8 regulatory NSL complex subunit 1-like protein isoform X1 n=1 Tax=Solea senegalensis TaxID=28829 RepID=UPI001CD86133|nr:KAT8 regulatory NSL complex subunit 1-like protein isoform X1 [Solea senegalensis]XP_043875996.1 KAT8 regulatory NSL complex subunit 1-like protein isoform X1 [Solea senegalensis]